MKICFFKNTLEQVIRFIAALCPLKQGRRNIRDFLFEHLDYYFDFKKHYEKINNYWASSSKRTALLISHELSLTGAPLMLLEGAKFLIEHNFKVVLLSFACGPLEDEFKKLDIPVYISRAYRSHPSAIKMMSQNSDLLVANTIMCASWAIYASCPEKLMWWLHESEEIELMAKKRPKLYARALSEAKNIYSVSAYAASFIEKYASCKILHQGIDDIAEQYKMLAPPEKKKHGLRFAVVGTFGARKNQAIMLKALELLTEEYLNEIEIIFIGKKEGGYFQALAAKVQANWAVSFAGEVMEPEKKWALFQSIDVFFVPSIDEPFSLVVLEAMMLSKPVVVSDKVGAKDLLINGDEAINSLLGQDASESEILRLGHTPSGHSENGFIFKSGDSNALKDIFLWFLNNREKIESMGLKSRNIFQRKASLLKFKNEFMAAVDKIVVDKNNVTM